MADAANVTNTAIMAGLLIDYTIDLQTGRVGHVGHVNYIFAARTVDVCFVEFKEGDVEKFSISNVS